MNGQIIGKWKDTVQRTPQFFAERFCTVDCRGDIRVAGTAVFGFYVCLFSESHGIGKGVCGPSESRRLWIDEECWIASCSTLAACWVQHNSVVSAGSVVTGVVVPPYSLVQGNPAQLVASYDTEVGRWKRLPEPRALLPWSDRRY